MIDSFYLKENKGKKESVEQFHLALREIDEHCNLGGIEDELIRNIFIANMYDQEPQMELLIRMEGQSMISIVGRSAPICNLNFRGGGNKSRN